MTELGRESAWKILPLPLPPSLSLSQINQSITAEATIRHILTTWVTSDLHPEAQSGPCPSPLRGSSCPVPLGAPEPFPSASLAHMPRGLNSAHSAPAQLLMPRHLCQRQIRSAQYSMSSTTLTRLVFSSGPHSAMGISQPLAQHEACSRSWTTLVLPPVTQVVRLKG